MTEPVDIDELAERIAERLRVPDDRPLLTLTQTMERLGIKRRTLYDHIAKGHLKVVELGPQQKRVEPAEVDRFIAERRKA